MNCLDLNSLVMYPIFLWIVNCLTFFLSRVDNSNMNSILIVKYLDELKISFYVQTSSLCLLYYSVKFLMNLKELESVNDFFGDDTKYIG